ncbi:hypothetical protein GCM10023340_36650 [Nocardioides marinquilinus]|uniref:Uncharacterized protein n=1 Tax=Nocardioides marinquilinus TaxID=1210400 RepID=A0ABP9Q4L1_9ACTN
MTTVRTRPRSASRTLVAIAASAALLLGATACGDGDDGEAQASDPAGTDPSQPQDDASADVPAPPEVPAAPGPVSSDGLAMVMDTGDGPELCLGAIAESYPPQCSGPAITGWSWADQQGVFEKQGATRWGQFAVTGTWDGETFGVTEATPAALYDPMGAPTGEGPGDLPEPAERLSDTELQRIAEEVGADLPGAQGAYVERGHVLATVTYDDGTLQAWADEAYGAGVVVVTGALLDA